MSRYGEIDGWRIIDESFVTDGSATSFRASDIDRTDTGEVGVIQPDASVARFAGRPCSRLSHALDGSVRDDKGRCAKCDAEATG